MKLKRPRTKGEHYLEDARRALDSQPIDEVADEADGYFEAQQSHTLPNLKNKAVQRSETFMRELAAVKGAMRAKATRQKSGLKRYLDLDTVDEERPAQTTGGSVLEPMNLF